jgi:hypothetical protein
MWPRNRLFQLIMIGLILFLCSRMLERCENRLADKQLYVQNASQTGVILTQSAKDSARAVVLQLQNDSLKRQNDNLLDGNAMLIAYAQTSDSLLRMQTDSTRRAKQEAYYIKLREESNNKSIQQMFWVLSNGQEELRQTLESLRKESTRIAEHNRELSAKLADSTILVQNSLQRLVDSLQLRQLTPSNPQVSAMGKKSSKSHKNKSSINERKRQREARRRTKQIRRRTLLKN